MTNPGVDDEAEGYGLGSWCLPRMRAESRKLSSIIIDGYESFSDVGEGRVWPWKFVKNGNFLVFGLQVENEKRYRYGSYG